MIAAFLALHDIVVPLLAGFLTVFLRVGGMMLLLPGLGDRMIPTRIRLVVALALTAAVTPAVDVPGTFATDIILTETIIGLAFGAALRFIAQALIMAGMMAAQLTSLAQLFGTVEPSSAIGNLLNIAGLCLIMAAGLHLHIVSLLIHTYDVMPLGMVMPGGDVAQWGISRLAHAFGFAFALAAPFALGALLYNVAMGVINRAMPQLMVALVGAPAITGASAVILLLAAPFILTAWKTAMLAVLANPITGALP